jgi:hypothetical protein
MPLRRPVPLALVGLVTSVLAACASSRGSRPSAAEQAAVAALAASDSAAGGRAPNPVVGTYNCIRTAVAGSTRSSLGYQSQGYLTLAADSSYRFSASPMVGRYSVSPTRAVTWSGGYFADKGPPTTTVPAGGARRVELAWKGRDGSTQWVCGVTAPAPR